MGQGLACSGWASPHGCTRRRIRPLLAVSLKHWKARGGGGGSRGGLRCTAVLLHHWG